LAEEVVQHSERTHMREVFSHQRLREGVYNSSQMDTQWTPEIEADFAEWLETHRYEDYAQVDWSREEGKGRAEETLLG
jgi:hypothetical protein